MSGTPRFTRRDFLVTVPVASGAIALMPSLALTPVPVVAFHLDQPYVDLTGLGKPYVPPAGVRSGAPLAALSDEALSRYYGLI
jgi:hypothetical protein